MGEDMAMEDMVAMEATVMERDLLKLKLKLMLSQDTPEDMEDMDMEDMVVMDVATTERGRLMLRLDTTVDTPEDMEVMEVTDVATTERGKLMLRLDTPEDMEDMDMEAMVVMDVATMERGRLKLNPAMVVMDMVVMAVHMEVMVDMVIAVKFLPLFIIPPPIIDILIGFKTKNMNKLEPFQKAFTISY